MSKNPAEELGLIIDNTALELYNQAKEKTRNNIRDDSEKYARDKILSTQENLSLAREVEKQLVDDYGDKEQFLEVLQNIVMAKVPNEKLTMYLQHFAGDFLAGADTNEEKERRTENYKKALLHEVHKDTEGKPEAKLLATSLLNTRLTASTEPILARESFPSGFSDLETLKYDMIEGNTIKFHNSRGKKTTIDALKYYLYTTQRSKLSEDGMNAIEFYPTAPFKIEQLSALENDFKKINPELSEIIGLAKKYAQTTKKESLEEFGSIAETHKKYFESLSSASLSSGRIIGLAPVAKTPGQMGKMPAKSALKTSSEASSRKDRISFGPSGAGRDDDRRTLSILSAASIDSRSSGSSSDSEDSHHSPKSLRKSLGKTSRDGSIMDSLPANLKPTNSRGRE